MPFRLRGKKGNFAQALKTDAYFVLLSFDSSLTVAFSS
jgi:hypothetical protein